MMASSIQEAQEKKEKLIQFDSVERVETISDLIPKNQEQRIQWISKQKEEILPLIEFSQTQNQGYEFNLLFRELEKLKFKIRPDNKKWSPDKKPKEKDMAEVHGLLEKITQKKKSISQNAHLPSLLKYETFIFSELQKEIQYLKNNFDLNLVKIDQLPDKLKDRFIGKTGKILLQIFSSFDIFDHDKMDVFVKDLRDVDRKVTGVALQVYESSRIMKDGYVLGGFYALLAIIILVWITFRRILPALLALLPLFLGSLWTLGWMQLFDIPFNLANLVILPIIVGIGVDNGIHIVHRYLENHPDPVKLIFESTGKAVIISSLTSMIGFGSLMIAHHQGIYSIGLLLSVGIGSCLLVSVTILPLLLHYIKEKGYL